MSESTPSDPASDPAALEVLRAWLVGDVLHCSVGAEVFEDPGSWGAVLADLARYVAFSLQKADGADPAATLRAIRSTFEQELDQSLAGPVDGPATEGA
jgi:hypothetical protein